MPPVSSRPSFGTSGLRGLVTELTPALVQAYTSAFLRSCPTGGAVHLGWDLRPSSPDIAGMVAQAVSKAGMDVVRHGPVPTPALAMVAMAQRQAAIMVTGSHIPADRNGLKFYVPEGEITKAQEAAIQEALALPTDAAVGAVPDTPIAAAPDAVRWDRCPAPQALAAFGARYRDAYGPDALAGMRVGVYQHSAVGRDLMMDVLAALGAAPVALGRSDRFIPVDTEAVDPATRANLSDWAATHGLDAIVSSDGDADRPLVADSAGRVVPGDVLGALTARALGAADICTPVSSNSLVDRMGNARMTRTRIGSPYVIAAMLDILAQDPRARVVGYEANGGFLLGFDAQGPTGPLAPLMTRDFLLPIIAPLAAARAQGQSLAALQAGLPARFTAADRVQDVPTAATRALLDRMIADPDARAEFFAGMGPELDMDLTDGLRLRFAGDEVVHLRPSGNAPECRCYAEAASDARAAALVASYMNRLRARLASA